MIAWRLHRQETTVSTNLDARTGEPGDVFAADFQTAGRGRLGHVWCSPAKANLLMSAVLSTADRPPEEVATLPLVVGLAVVRAVTRFLDAGARRERPLLKWPNDVLVGGRKLAGILCERHGDRIVAGIGVNVHEQEFPPEIAARAAFLGAGTVDEVRERVLDELGMLYETWRMRGFASVHPEIAAVDALKGRYVTVRQTDDDREPVAGVSAGIRPDGSLDVAGRAVYAGEVVRR